MFDIEVLPPTDADIAQLEAWRGQFTSCSLELPEGYVNDGVATAVAKKVGGELIGSLTGTITIAASLDPTILNPNAGRLNKLAGLFAMTRAIEYQARIAGAAASFIAVPDELAEYQELVVKCGFEPVAQGCKLYRHSFRT